jgi:hypothetical protein
MNLISKELNMTTVQTYFNFDSIKNKLDLELIKNYLELYAKFFNLKIDLNTLLKITGTSIVGLSLFYIG